MNQTFQRGRGACVGVGGHCRARYHIAGYRIDGYHSVPLSRHDQRGQRNAIVCIKLTGQHHISRRLLVHGGDKILIYAYVIHQLGSCFAVIIWRFQILSAP